MLVLKSGGGYGMKDVLLLSRHIRKNMGDVRIVCINDKVKQHHHIKQYEIDIIPMQNNWNGWWAKYNLFSPDLQQYRPFLYVDLDTVVLKGLNKVVFCVKENGKFVMLRDFYQKKLASGMMWIPESSDKVDSLWANKGNMKFGKWNNQRHRMDYYIRNVIQSPDLFFQDIVSGIYSFKPRLNGGAHWLNNLPEDSKVVCFHGSPNIWKAMGKVEWVKEYVYEQN